MINRKMITSILNCCARIETDSSQQHQLRTYCETFQQWDDLLLQVELQGMGPLLSLHLASSGATVPDTFLRGLRFLCLRHQRANAILMDSLQQILSIFAAEGIQSLVLKGGALCQTLYPEIGLRPMRDIDLLLSEADANRAHLLLQKHGFRVSPEVLPEHYYHLSPLLLSVDDMQVCIELHTGLFPKDPPYYQSMSFLELYKLALPFEVSGEQAYTLADEDMLWHLYQHGFHAPLTYEPYKSISVVDMVSLVEARVDTLDWEKIRLVYPELYRALPLFHYLTPWSGSVLRKIPELYPKIPSGVGKPFKGWPRVKLSQRKDQGLLAILSATFFPNIWWLMLYYSTAGGVFSTFWCRTVRHPIHIFRWVKIYGTRTLKGRTESAAE